MSIKKLFDQNRQANTVGKYLKKSAVGDLSGGIESAEHLEQAIIRKDTYIPPLDYGNPDEFAKFGSAEKYYKNAFDYITFNYPYDGSRFEKEKFYNDLNPIEKYVLTEKYPKSTGFVSFGTAYGTPVSKSSHYYTPGDKTEYIQIKGGPHSGTIFSTKYRQNNLEFGGPSGSTVEFFLSKSLIPGDHDTNPQSPIQVIFDLWNGVSTGSVYDDETNGCYGNLRIELSKSLEDRFLVTMLSGTKGYVTQSIPTTGGIGNFITGSGFNHFAFAFNTSGSSPGIDFYVNGVCHEANITASGHQAGQIDLVTGSLIGNIGALRVAPSGTEIAGASNTPLEGDGKLSGSIDEFRFWRSARTGEQVGRHWFSHVDGGSNTQDANVGLGVYYKFNEGITGTSSVDNVVLDYSGRISNGTWVGYAAGARDTGSAITQQSLTASVVGRTEVEDPIVIPSASNMTVRREEMIDLGRQHDYTNSSYLMNTFPAWITEQDEKVGGELRNLTQIMANYFDTLYAQISHLTKIKEVQYLSGSATGSINEFQHNDRLVENLGMDLPELFENASLLSQFLKRDEDINYEQDLGSIKATIYKNLYNNLAHIFKSKGNEKAVRNFIRCFGIDEDILGLSVYGSNTDYKLDTNYRADVSNKKYADFTGLADSASNGSNVATIYQYPNPDLPEAYGFISGSSGSLSLIDFGFTTQCEIVFPNKQNARSLEYEAAEIVTSSLFGWHTPKDILSTSTDTTTMASPYNAGIHVVAIKSASQMAEIESPDYQVKDAFFKVLDSQGSVILTSSVFTNVYENQKWNIALSVHPKRFPFAQNSGANANLHDGYDIDFYAVNYDSGIKRNSFYTTASLTYKSGSDIVSAPKRLYMGAHRTNFTGTLLTSSDVRASSLRYWADVLPTGAVDLHARDVDSFGRINPAQQAYAFQKHNPGIYIPKIDTLALNWDFADITGSDTSGRFNVNDFSSGSFASGSRYLTHSGAIDPAQNRGALYVESPQHIIYRQHTGRGDFFPTSSKPIRKEMVYTERVELPEYVLSSDMVRIKDIDDEAFAPMMRPERLYYSIEKSMYKSISRRMLNLFASIDDLNNLIGEPVNRFRTNYKSMEKLRQIFFSKVDNTPDLEKYLDYYKWVDISMGQMLEQLFPASARVAPGVRTMIESHLLERPKYKYTFMGNRKRSFQGLGGGAANFVESLVGAGFSSPAPVTNLIGSNVAGSVLGYRHIHAPLPSSPQKENENSWWWKTRAERYNVTISQSNPGVMATREAVFAQAKSFYTPARIYAVRGEVDSYSKPSSNGLGTPKENKKQVGVAGVSFGGLESKPDSVDEFIPNQKEKRELSASLNGDDMPARILLPFTPVSSTVDSGYQKQLQDLSITNVDFANLHVRPESVQSPFTTAHVGGQQARSVDPLAQKIPSANKRKESYKLELATGGGTFSVHKTDGIPKGQYMKEPGASRPVNIKNIRTTTGSLTVAGGVSVVGNYTNTYEIYNTTDRNSTNTDFALNSELYYNASLTGGCMPTAFLTSVSRRTAGLTGSLEFAAPRQKSTVRVNKSVISDRFSAPGSKLDSKQLFRDVPSDQYSPNNALPFRNIEVRQKLQTLLKRHTGWGGFQTASLNTLLTRFDSIDMPSFNAGIVTPSGAFPAVHGDDLSDATASLVGIHKTQRNTILRPQLVSGNLNSPLVEIMTTGSLRDNAYISRPIPDGDRLSWFMRLSHSQGTIGDWPGQNVADNFHKFILSSSRFPADITLYTSSIANSELWQLYGPNYALQINGLFSNSAGQLQYIWEANGAYGWVPWTQTRFGQYTTLGKFNARQNFYVIDAPVMTFEAEEVEQVDGKKLMPNRKGQVIKDLLKANTQYRDRSLGRVTPGGGNQVTYFIGKRYKEPVVTSRYKPIIHHVKTPRGTANKTDQDFVDVTLKYSYGNELQGFANRGLNIDLGNKQSFKLGNTKRPYEILRDNFVANVDPSVDGVELIKMMTYEETIYPREIHTYASASRAREYYKNSFWRSDIENTGSLFVLKSGVLTLEALINNANIEQFNRPWNRRVDDRQLEGRGYSSSFGYFVRMDEQFPTGSFTWSNQESPNESWRTASGSVGYAKKYGMYVNSPGGGMADFSNYGTGSTWPLDSFYYAHPHLQAYLTGVALSASALSPTTKLLACMASTLPAGELMMPHYGVVLSGAGDNTGSADDTSTGGIRWNTSSLNSCQYVYSVPTEVLRQTGDGGKKKFVAEFNAIGGPVTRVAWTAAEKRRFVDGPKKGTLAPARYPWYNNYEDWAQEVRLSGKDQTIIPEFRISTLMNDYKNLGSFTTVLSSALDITGATNDVSSQGAFNTKDKEFLPRYGTSDVVEYLKTFMAKSSKDAQFNKDPRHLEIKSEATLKLLPYEGFYPVLRTLELATQFSKSYAEYSLFTGEPGNAYGNVVYPRKSADEWQDTVGASADPEPSGAYRMQPAVFRALSRPFFAPGIVYNSIKSGIGVSYPILRKNAVEDFRWGTMEHPTAGPLSGSVTSVFSPAIGKVEVIATGSERAAITVPGGRRRRNEGGAANFEFFDKTLGFGETEQRAQAGPSRFFYSDAVPFEGIFKPIDYIGDQVRPIILGDHNPILFGIVTGSVNTSASIESSAVTDAETGITTTTTTLKLYDDELYKLGMSNFMANIPKFFLKQQEDGGVMSKFVAEIPAKANPDSPAGATPPAQTEARRVAVSKEKAYIMEIGLKQSDRHMMYSNPAAFGNATATGSFDWNEMKSTNVKGVGAYGVGATASLASLPDDPNIVKSSSFALTGGLNPTTGRDITGNSGSNIWGQTYFNSASQGSSVIIFKYSADETTPSRLQGLTEGGSGTYEIGFKDATALPISHRIGRITASINLAYANGDTDIYATIGAGDQLVLTHDILTSASNGNVITRVGDSGAPVDAVGIPEGPFFGGQTKPFYQEASLELGTTGSIPAGRRWPYARAEFAPFTPAYYYGPSICRITYVPKENKEVSLEEILSGEDLYVEFVNENGHYYDFDSGSFMGDDGRVKSIDGMPAYGWNRAWQNRQDIDASIVIDNLFPTDGAGVSPRDRNKWVIMPKWECPILDFPTNATEKPTVQGGASSVISVFDRYDFGTSTGSGDHDPFVTGMWHQYGAMPSSSAEGVFMYISDVSVDSTEFRLLGNPTGTINHKDGTPSNFAQGVNMTGSGEVVAVRKVPKFVFDSGRTVDSLARLVGFKEEDIQPPGAFIPERARKLGQIAEDNEKTISEAIVAMPYYMDKTTQSMKVMTLKANPNALGPKLKEFRKAFTKYSLPPALKKSLENLLPPNYPKVPSFINPFGGDEYDETLPSEEEVNIPIVYLMEHSIALSRQDLADIWQGVMPDIAATMKTSVSAIDHYMPGEAVETKNGKTIFPELILKELELGIPRNGHPRVDMLDIAALDSEDGFKPDIKWMVFKVKERGIDKFSRLVLEELNGGPGSLSYDSIYGYISEDLPTEQKDFLKKKKVGYTKGLWSSEKLGEAGNTYNWPYDYCSLIELGKLTVKTGFRPELTREIEDISADRESDARSRGERAKKEREAQQQQQRMMQNLPAMSLPPNEGPPNLGSFIRPNVPPGTPEDVRIEEAPAMMMETGLQDLPVDLAPPPQFNPEASFAPLLPQSEGPKNERDLQPRQEFQGDFMGTRDFRENPNFVLPEGVTPEEYARQNPDIPRPAGGIPDPARMPSSFRPPRGNGGGGSGGGGSGGGGGY